MIRNILLLSMVLLFTITSANAQTLQVPYVTTDKPLYYYGEDIIFTVQLDDAVFGPPTMYVIGTVSQSTMIIGHQFELDAQNKYTITHPTYSPDFTKHSVMPNDGYYTAHVAYSIYDPILGVQTRHITTTFMYIEYDYSVTDRFVANENDIADLQNTPQIPSDLLSRITTLETKVAKITTIEDTQNIISTSLAELTQRVSEIELEINTLDTTQTRYDTRITTVENTLGYIEALQNDVTSLSSDVTNLQTDVTDIQTKVTTIIAENATPQDVEQNLRIEGMESDITELQFTNSTIFSTLISLDQVDKQNLNQHMVDFDQQNFQLVELSSQHESYEYNLNLLGISTDANANSIITLENRATAIETDTIPLLERMDRFDKFTEGTTTTLQFMGQRGQDNQDKIGSIQDSLQYQEITNNNFGEQLESLEIDTASLHGRDKQIEQKMFREHESITGEFKEEISKINSVNATATDNQEEITIHGERITTLETEINNIQITTSPNDANQNVRLLDLENQYRTVNMELTQLYKVVHTISTNFAGIQQSLDGFIQEHVNIWNELDHKQNRLSAP